MNALQCKCATATSEMVQILETIEQKSLTIHN